MSRSLIVDASVAFKWFVEEDGSDTARAILQAPRRLIAPELLLAEVANIAWKVERRGEIRADQSASMLAHLPDCFAEIVPMRHLMGPAQRLAIGLRHPVYDCLYLALAMDRNTTVVTADERFAALVQVTSLAERVILLDEAHRVLA